MFPVRIITDPIRRLTGMSPAAEAAKAPGQSIPPIKPACQEIARGHADNPLKGA